MLAGKVVVVAGYG
ncbi:MAG TPA: hypothetical protein DCG43_04635, partial [Gammaproteobacteria bacterium]|nr:hypothetical protein [Gammaproteobacteria bacterium]